MNTLIDTGEAIVAVDRALDTVPASELVSTLEATDILLDVRTALTGLQKQLKQPEA